MFDDKLKVAKEGKREVLNSADFEEMLDEEIEKCIATLENKNLKITKIGHRVVHGKNLFHEPIEITLENLTELEKLNYLAPLHNPFNVLGIKACRKMFAGIKNIAVFDTEFFKDLPEVAFTYALPENIVKEFGYRKYGFHGISHEFVASKVKGKKIITCHLGGGCSITAIKDGRPIDTSMGFTPMQGLVMMTRAGDMDFGIVLEMAKNFGLEKTSEILNKKSGVKGICGESEMLKVLEMVKAGDEKAKLALDVFVYSIKKYIGAYFAILGGCDVLVFTGAIGFGSEKIRNMICKDLDILKKTKVLAIETDEELAIANKIINF